MATAERLGIDLEQIEEMLARSYTFPARWYSDSDIYRFELEHIFRHCWQLVGPLDKLEQRGDVMVCQVADIPVVVTRDLQGELRGFVNVCRHRAFPVVQQDCHRKTLQCGYHAWTYELDGRLRKAPREEREDHFDRSELSLLPVAVDTWKGFVFVNPDASAPALREAHPEFEPLAEERGLDVTGFRFHDRYAYEIPANWKVWVENATECYHCPTIHANSFSDAWVVDADVYEYVNVGQLFGQFAPYNPKAKTYRPDGKPGDRRGFRFVYIWPTSFFAQDDYVAFPGIIIPTGPETCRFLADVYVHPELSQTDIDEWVELYTQTLQEDADAVLVQQPGLRSQMVPFGRLMPRSESTISIFHRLVYEAFAGALRNGA